MRTLIALVVLVIALAYAVVYKTSPNAEDQPPTQAPHDSSIGIMTFGVTSAEAASPADPESKAVTAVSESTNADVHVVPPATEDVAVHEPMQPTLEPETGTEADSAIDYVVREDDTMYRIILNHYGTYSEDILRAISDANNLSDPSDIGIGDKVTLPVIEGVGAPKKR